MLYKHYCMRCGHRWPSKQKKPRICPKCKTAYWDMPKIRQGGDAALFKDIPPCPVCWAEKSSFLNLARHMVMSERPSGPHQEWLQSFLRKTFPQYAFKHDGDVAKALERYWKKYRSWPAD
jgi:hypothetical protein